MAKLNVDTWALKKLVLDKADGIITSPMVANAADASGRGIMLSVVQDGVPADLTAYKVYLVWSHENGNQDMTQFSMVNAAQGVCKVYYPPAMMHGGKVIARISVYVNEQLITGSRNFIVNVERNPIDEDDAMSDESFSTFLQAVVDLNTATDRADAAADRANTAAESAEDVLTEKAPAIITPLVEDAVAEEMAKYSAVSFSVNPDDGGLDITYSY